MILTILTILISVGYSALNQNLSVSGEAFLRAKDNIRISRIELSDAANDGYETYNPEYSKRTTKMYTTLPKDDSSVTYTVKVTNSTGIRYKVGSIEVTSTNSNVSCTPSIEVDSILEDGVTEFTVTANYENGMSQDTNLNACDIKYEFVPLDATPPTLAVQLVNDNGNTKTIKITAIDEAEGSGLSPDNIYKYYLSTSSAELSGGEWKDYTNNTEFEISGDFEVKYLWIYPVKDRAGNISGENSSVEPYSVGKYIFIDDVPTLYNVIAKEALTDGVAKLYTEEHNDTYNEIGTKKIFHFYGSNDSKGAEVLTKNNVIFGGFCWQMIRTTDTGGTKLIYNGVPKEVDGKKVCTNSGTEQQIGTSAFNDDYRSPAYVGYMHNTVYSSQSKSMSSSDIYKYANSFTYSNGTYKLSSDAVSIDVTNSTESTKLNNAHYTCFDTTGECETVFYIYFLDGTKAYYIELQSGKNVEDALNEMLSSDDVNQTSSTIKDVIDTWYANNMTNYTKYLEDTVFCNDRSISSYGGWDSNDGNVTKSLYFKNSLVVNNLYCTNITDRFSVGNSKAKLTYPVGLISAPEMHLLGNDNIRKTGNWYWLASPHNFYDTLAFGRYVKADGYVSHSIVGNVGGIFDSNGPGGVRPLVSLAPGIQYTAGTGSTTDPYIIDLNAPTVTQETIIDGEREKIVRITASDDYGLSNENKYQYYLSTSETELVGGEWKDYTLGEIFTLTGENETRYLWIYPVMDNAGNINGDKTDINTPYVLMTITFKDKNTLYNVLRKEYASGSGLSKLYSGKHNDSYNETGTQNIYHFYGEDDTSAESVLTKNNVLFGGFCWQMIRTTDTGGAKLIYNGVPKTVPTYLDKNGYNVTTNSSDSYTFNDDTNEWTNTTGSNQTNTLTYTLVESGNYNLIYDASENGQLYVTVNDEVKVNYIQTVTGNASGDVDLGSLSNNDEIKVVFSVDGEYEDEAPTLRFKMKNSNSKDKYLCNNSGEEQQIGTSEFDTNYGSLAYVGYMYDNIYLYNSKRVSLSEEIYSSISETKLNFINNYFFYSDSITYDSSTGKYTLVNGAMLGSSGNSYSVRNKYTTKVYGSKSGSKVYHILRVSITSDKDGNMVVTTYYFLLENGKTLDSYNNVYSYGTSYTKNSDGTYTLNDATYMPISSYISNYSTLNDRYVCKYAVNNVCSDVWHVISTSDHGFYYFSPKNEYKYAKGFTYENGKYILNDESVMVWDLGDTLEQAKLNNAHYTCFNTSGECETLSYVYYNGARSEINYLELNNGIGIEEALQEMLYANDVNKTSSTIKNTIDTWYANNMTNYTQYLEDTVFCNDRSISNYGGLNSDGGSVTGTLEFKNYNVNNELYCANSTDRFSTSSEKAKLTYPVGLISAPEMQLLGNNNIRKTGKKYWLISPGYFDSRYAGVNFIDVNGTLDSYRTFYDYGVRPSVSLKPNTEYSSGTGSTTDPYVIS